MQNKVNLDKQPAQFPFARAGVDLIFSLGVILTLIMPFAFFLYYEGTGSALRVGALVFAGVILLDGVIVCFASLKDYLNRDVILLTQRLTSAYISAIEKSALNPNVKSIPSHE